MALTNRGPDYDKEYPTQASLEAVITAQNAPLERLQKQATAESAVNTRRQWEARSPFRTPLPDMPPTRVVPDVEGRIESILLTVPPHKPGGKPNPDEPVDPREDRHLKNLMRALGPGRQYIVLCHEFQQKRVDEWRKNADIPPEEVTPVLSVWNYSIFAQDAYVALNDGKGDPILCEGVLFNRSDDMSIADDVAAQAPVRAQSSILFFQGGNILGSEARSLVGADYIWKNKGRKGMEDKAGILAAFEKLLGTEVISIGREHDKPLPANARAVLSGLYQPIFHIDMFVTLTGVRGKESGKEIAFVGRPKKAREILKQCLGPFDFDALFEETEQQLSNYYEVRQLPFLVQYGDLNGALPFKTFYHLTYNNVLIDHYLDTEKRLRRRVIMPTYGTVREDGMTDEEMAIRKELDTYARHAWSELGFEVLEMEGAEDMAWARGSIHCITKVLKRTPLTPEPVPPAAKPQA